MFPFLVNNLEHFQLYLSIVLIFVVVVTGIFSYTQEAKSSAIMDSFKKMVPKYAQVLRDGIKVSINSEDIVLGDIVDINCGEQIPADLRVITAVNCKVDNSSLTGESEPQPRKSNEGNETFIESKNILFFSTNCVEGRATGVVIRTGDNTFIGNIANLAANLEQGESPINKEIHHFIRLITIFSLILATIFFILSITSGYGAAESLVFFIGLIVANVPEGLLATVTVCLTLTAKRMAQKNCLVKHLEAVETLGSTSVICSDKTGTLTQNKMTVSHFWFSKNITTAEKLENDHFDVDYRSSRDALNSVVKVCCLNSKAEFKPNQENLPPSRR